MADERSLNNSGSLGEPVCVCVFFLNNSGSLGEPVCVVLSTTKSVCSTLGSNPGLCCEKLTTNCLTLASVTGRGHTTLHWHFPKEVMALHCSYTRGPSFKGAAWECPSECETKFHTRVNKRCPVLYCNTAAHSLCLQPDWHVQLPVVPVMSFLSSENFAIC